MGASSKHPRYEGYLFCTYVFTGQGGGFDLPVVCLMHTSLLVTFVASPVSIYGLVAVIYLRVATINVTEHLQYAVFRIPGLPEGPKQGHFSIPHPRGQGSALPQHSSFGIEGGTRRICHIF